MRFTVFGSLLPGFPTVFVFPVFDPLRELLSDERSNCEVVLEKRLKCEELLEPPLKVRGLLLSALLELPEMRADVLPREKPWTGELTFPVRLGMASIGRATLCLPGERMVDRLLSDERPLEPLKDFPLNVAPLLPLPNERGERSELGIWMDWLLRELKLRDESLPNDGRECPDELLRDCPDELLDDMLREDDDPLLPLWPIWLDERPPWLDRSLRSSLSRAMAKLAVRKAVRTPKLATHLRTRLRRIWGPFSPGGRSSRPHCLDLVDCLRIAATRYGDDRTSRGTGPIGTVLGKHSCTAHATLLATGFRPLIPSNSYLAAEIAAKKSVVIFWTTVPK